MPSLSNFFKHSTLFIALALSGCGSDSSNNDELSATTALPVNQSPQIIVNPVTQINELEKFNLQINGSDDDNDALTYTAKNLPDWATIDATSGVISGVPSLTGGGIYKDIVLSVSDGKDVVYAPAFTLTVNDSLLVRGKVIDGYISAAKVFLDNNLNGVLDEHETWSLTDQNGNYELLLTDGSKIDFHTKPILAYIGVGADDISRDDDDFASMPFTLAANIYSNVNIDVVLERHISPYTQLVWQKVKPIALAVFNQQKSCQELYDANSKAKQDLASYYDAPSVGLFADFRAVDSGLTKDAQDRLIAVATSLIKEQQIRQSAVLDLDSDGIVNALDDDIDGDNVENYVDAFVLDRSENLDIDLDGIGNNADLDDDNDGYADSDEILAGSNPLDSQSMPSDLDKDFIPDVIDDDIDGDSVLNTDDVFPENPLEWLDTDGDLIGDNSDPDIDGDGLLNSEDEQPLVFSLTVGAYSFIDAAFAECIYVQYENEVFLRDITSVYCQDQSALSLLDLNEFTALTILDVSGSQVSDWQEISQLVQLNWLDLSSTNFIDVNLLSELTVLQTLSLQSSQVINILPLQDYKSIIYLNLYGLNIANNEDYITVKTSGKNIQSKNISTAEMNTMFQLSNENRAYEFFANNIGVIYQDELKLAFTWTGKGKGTFEVNINDGNVEKLTLLKDEFSTGKLFVENRDAEYNRTYKVVNVVKVNRTKSNYSFSSAEKALPSSYDICVGVNEINELACTNFESNGALEVFTMQINDEIITLPSDAIVQSGGVLGKDAYGFCALFDNKVHCDDGNFGLNNANPDVIDPQLLAVGNSHYCVAETTGNVKCFGDAANLAVNSVPSLTNTTALVSGNNFSCAIADNQVYCWGNDTYGLNQPPKVFNNPYGLYATNTNVCVTDADGVTCWGNDEHLLSQVPDALTNVSNIVMQSTSICAQQSALVTCWGQLKLEHYDENLGEVVFDGYQQRVTVPDTVEVPAKLTLGLGREYCVLAVNADITCFADTPDESYSASQIELLNADDITGNSTAICAFSATKHVCKVKSTNGTDSYKGELFIYEPFVFQ